MYAKLRDPGVYLLLIEVKKDCVVKTRGRTIFNIRKGTYIYVGSALRGLCTRLRRYVEKRYRKRSHWHIDFLLSQCDSEIICILCSSLRYYSLSIRAEVLLSFTLSAVRYLVPIYGFGCSDIRHVRSNLYYVMHDTSTVKVLRDMYDVLYALFRNLIEVRQ
ncbi:MAG: DUF123 domain-containing protein [Crenarchaeota archaeon]|nr:DUF123 domain-containing protein [Thermoproteota archaeon]